MRRQTRVLLAIAVVCSFFTIAAGSASADYAFKGTFAGPRGEGAPCPEPAPGALCAPGRAAVEQSGGSLFVVDSGNNRVQVFAPNDSGTADYLTVFGSGELSAPWGIAIDEDAEQASVYVADAGNEEIVKYDSDEAATPTFTVDPSFTSPSKGSGPGQVEDFHAALAIDPTTHELLVADNANKRIARFEADGTPAGSFDGSEGAGSPGAFSGPIDLAVNSAGDVYVIDANGDIAEQLGTSQALRYSGSGEYEATLSPVGPRQRPATVAVNRFDDSVIVSGDQDGVYENETPRFYGFDSDDNPTSPIIANGSAEYDSVSGLAIASGASDVLYAALDVGNYLGTLFGSPQIQVFEQSHPVAPTIVSQSASVSQNEAVLKARIKSGGELTKYHFEYGSTNSYGHKSPEMTIPAGDTDVTVSAPIVGLAPGVSYHFRVVASNSLGTDEGSDQSFAPESTGSDFCPNAATRQAQHVGFLPDCRAYEQVTPVAKNGASVSQASTESEFAPPVVPAAAISPEGDAVTYQMSSPLEDAQSAPLWNLTGSERGAQWLSHGIESSQRYSWPVTGFFTSVLGLSADQSTVVTASESVLAPGAEEGDSNYYSRDASSGRYLFMFGIDDPEVQSIEHEQPVVWVSSGGQRVFFLQTHALTPGALELPAEGFEGFNLYEYLEGQVRLVTSPGWTVRGNQALTDVRIRTVAKNGHRVFFSQRELSGAEEGLFMSGNGQPAIPISASHRPGDSTTPVSAEFRGASQDGSVAYFSTSEQLTPDAEPSGEKDKKEILYRYEVEDGKLIAITPSSAPGDPYGPDLRALGGASRSIGVSDSGAYVYFRAGGVLAPGAESDGNNIYAWHDDEIRLVATLRDGASSDPGRQWSLSPDGTKLVFNSLARLTAFDNTNGFKSCAGFAGLAEFDGHCAEAYLYDWNRNELSCASCPEVGSEPHGHAAIGGFRSLAGSTGQEFYPAAVRNDGTVFFDTPEKLVAEDTNGKRDVYEYRSGVARLLSTGGSGSDSFFHGASVTGSDVFISTGQRLVGQDRDDQVDLYDVRIGGGLATQQGQNGLAPCVGSGCQGPPGLPPAGTSPASSQVRGPGNTHHAKPRHKRHGCGKARRGRDHHKKHAKKVGRNQRRAGACRGGNR